MSNVPSAGLDVAADLLQIGNRRAAVVTLGKYSDTDGTPQYTGVVIDNDPNPLNPLSQPDVFVGQSNTLGPGGRGSLVGIEGRRITITAIDNAGPPGPVVINGDVSINGAPVASPGYLEVKNGAAATVAAGFPVLFPLTASSQGGVTVNGTGDVFTLPTTGAYEITWRVTTSAGATPQFAWRLVSGAITTPVATSGTTALPSTTSALPGPGPMVGQTIVTVSVAPATLSLINTSLNTQTYYLVGDSVPASVVIRRIAA